MQLSSRRLRSRFLLVLAGVVVLSLTLYLLRAPLLTLMGRALVVSDPIERADLIYVMGGNPVDRPARAAALYEAHYAPTIAVPMEQDLLDGLIGIRLHPTLEATYMLQRLGVPRAAIVILRVPDGSTSTRDDARILANYVRGHGIQKVIVVTSEFHTRRARWAVRKAMKDQPVKVMMAPAIEPRVRPNNWWHTENGLVECAIEYLKFVHNLTHS